MEEFQSWMDKLTKEERNQYIVLLGFVIVSSFLYAFYTTGDIRVDYYYLSIGIIILVLGIYFWKTIVSRKSKTIYLYGDTRSNSEYYADINLRGLDGGVTVKKSTKQVSKYCFLCQKTELLPYTCKYCGNSYCSEHRIPEKHNCADL